MVKFCYSASKVAVICILILFFSPSTPLANLIPTVEEHDVDAVTNETQLPQALATYPLQGKYFEGDLNIPVELIQEYYNIDIQDETHLARRAVRSNSSFLWPNGIVPYFIGNDVADNVKITIQSAIQHWEAKTCVRFIKRTSQTDHIQFTVSHPDGGCFSEWVGRKGGRQIINLQQNLPNGSTCNTIGIVVHEIAHAVGFWHEHSRPDRDLYVSIVENNTLPGTIFQFQKRSYNEVDSLGVGYDYRSIMHYPTDAFSNCLTCPTIEVKNGVEYEKQGRPAIGQQNGLSAMDSLQANRLYYCPSALTPIRGILKMYVRFAKNLQDSFVRITTVDSNGIEHYTVTDIKGFSAWNEPSNILMGGLGFRPYFKIQIWSDNCSSMLGLQSSVCPLSRSQTVWIGPQSQSNTFIKHSADFNGYIWFDYNMTVDGNECSPNPCLNGGTCFDELSSYWCECTSDYVGTECETRLHRGILKITVKSARDLQYRQPGSLPSPYVNITAVYASGTKQYKYTETIARTVNPRWNQEVDMGGHTFRAFFHIQIWDANTGTAMSALQTVPLHPGNRSYTDYTYGGGSLQLQYVMIIDGNECSPNPCLNGGTCFDEFSSYRCGCTSDYVGTECETRLHRGILKITVKSVRDLQYTEPGSIPSPYVQITTVFPSGVKQYKYTEIKEHTVNPTWNEEVDMGGHTFRAFFHIQIWDANTGTAMSALQTFPLHPGGRSYTHDSYSGGSLQLHSGMIIDGNECSPDPCLNGGRCTDHFCRYTCSCDMCTAGSRCERRLCYRGNLRIYIAFPSNLDQYVRITAISYSGVRYYKNSRTHFETIDMGGHTFKPFFKIQLFNSDGSRLSSLHTVPIQGVQDIGEYKTVGFAYNMIIDGDDCSPNPCQNLGICRDQIGYHTCLCSSGYGGTDCRHRRGRLEITAHYGKDLPDKDGWLNKSDPYIEFIAVDSNGNTFRKATSIDGGTHNPNWNDQRINFGTNTWKYVKVKVFDSDPGSDDSLSIQRSWSLYWSSSHSKSTKRHYCYRGYVIFSYLFHH